MANFPSSLDTLANPTATTRRNDPGYELHAVISTLNDIAEQLEAKLGISASAAAANTVLRGTGSGSTAYGKIQAADLTPGTSTMLKIGEVAATGSSAVMEIASIPATYRALVIHWVGRSAVSNTSDTARLTFETTPTPGTYTHQRLYGQAATPAASENASGTNNYIEVGFLPAALSAATLTASGRIELPEYANPAIYKNVIAQNAGSTNTGTGGYTAYQSMGVWFLANPISLIRLTAANGNWTTASRMTIWGLPA